jgi:hypothetical protein
MIRFLQNFVQKASTAENLGITELTFLAKIARLTGLDAPKCTSWEKSASGK